MNLLLLLCTLDDRVLFPTCFLSHRSIATTEFGDAVSNI